MRLMKAILPALLLVLAGCLEYDERIELNADGSGKVRIHLAISEQTMGLAGAMKDKKKEADLFPVPPEEFTAELKKENLEVLSLRAESTGERRHSYIVIAFKDVKDLARSEYFGGRKLSFSHADGLYRLTQTIDVAAHMPGETKKTPKKPEPATDPGEKKEASPKAGTFPKPVKLDKERMKQLLKNASLTFSAQLVGGHVADTDGTDHRQTVSVWSFPLEDMVDKKPMLTMTAAFSPGPPPKPQKQETAKQEDEP